MAGEFDFLNSPDFGAPGGIRANQAAQMNNLSMQGQQTKNALAQGQLAVQPQMLQAEYLSTMASARLHAVQAGIGEEQLRESGILANVAMGRTPGSSVDMSQPMSSRMMQLSSQVLERGAPVLGLKLYEDSIRMLGAENSAKKSAADAMRAEQRADLLDMEKVERAWRMVETPEDVQKLTAEFRQTHKGEPAPWENLVQKGLPVSVMRDIMRDQTLSYKDKLAEEDRRTREKAVEEDRKARNSMTETLRNIQQQQADTAKQRADDAKKRGEIVPEPNTAEVKAAESLIKADFPDINPYLSQRVALEIAEAAKAARVRNPGINMREARSAAYQEAKKRLSTLTTKGIFKDTTKVTDALPMEADSSKRVVGQKYEQNGKVYEWAEEGGKKGWKEVK
jgi:hypothetical protein